MSLVTRIFLVPLLGLARRDLVILTVLLKDKGRLLVFCPGILLHASPFSDLQLKKENYFLMALSDHH